MAFWVAWSREMSRTDREKKKKVVGRVYGQTDRWTNRRIRGWWWYLYCCGISSYLTALTVSFCAYLRFYRSFPQSLTVEYQKQLRLVTHVSTEIVYPLCLAPPCPLLSLSLSSSSTSCPVDNKHHVAMPSRDKLGPYSQTHILTHSDCL